MVGINKEKNRWANTQGYNIDYENSWFVGDFESDREIAERMGLRFILAKGDSVLREGGRGDTENLRK